MPEKPELPQVPVAPSQSSDEKAWATFREAQSLYAALKSRVDDLNRARTDIEKAAKVGAWQRVKSSPYS